MAQQQKLAQQSQVQMPSAADLSLLLSLGMGGLDASQLANIDLQKLAMYLVSIQETTQNFEIRKSSKFKIIFSFEFTKLAFEKSFNSKI
jgi:hypothetical protein